MPPQPTRSYLDTPLPRRRRVWPGLLRRLSILLLALAVTVAGCSAADQGSSTDGQAAQGAVGEVDLTEVCPDLITFQTSWHLQIEHYVGFQLLARQGWEADPDQQLVTGPLVADGEDTGIDIQLRAGGPAVGFSKVSELMALDPNITLGLAPLDESVQLSAELPVTGVLASFEIAPQIILWDPQTHPEWHTIVDIGLTDTPVLYAKGTSTYIDYLVGSGQLRESQVDASFDAGHDRFVASGGEIATQEFVTRGPYVLEHEIEQWGRPVDYRLIHDTGYPNYQHEVVVRSGELEELTPCLERLVPIMQQGIVDFMNDPEPTIQLVQEVREASRQQDQDSVERARHAVEVMRSDGLVSDGPDGIVGNFDTTRVQELMDIVVPLFRGQDVELPEDLTVEDVATNQFIDDSISLPVAAAASPGPTPRAGQP